MNISKALILIVSPFAILLLAGGIFFTMGGIVNTGTSIPAGLYWKVDKPLAIGKTVVFCPPNQPAFQAARERGLISGGSCPDNFASMMLKVAGKRKDIVTINEQGVTVNEVLLPHSKPLTDDKTGQTMPAATLNQYELKDNEVLLMSESADYPFDSRYFGSVNTDQIDSVISPIF